LKEEHEGGLAGLYVVGGGSALPVVGRVLRERFGRRVHRSPYPFAATAIGLAIAADEEAGLKLRDRLSRHLGVFREADEGRAVAFDALLGRDTPLGGPPLVRTYRAAHNVGHFRFVECSYVEDGLPRGHITPIVEALFPFDPTLRGRALDSVAVERLERAGPLVEERYSVDDRGVVEVVIRDLDTGFEKSWRLGA
jgi:molecular chaperone DnaK (HSP70)